MPWTHATNWSTSPFSPTAGQTHSRIPMPTANSDANATARRTPVEVDARRPTIIDAVSASGGRRDPVALREAARHPADVARSRRVSADGVRHRATAVEQALELALVERDRADLALELVADVCVLGGQGDARRQAVEGARRHVVEQREVLPPRVREVLVQDDAADVLRAGHDPPATLVQEVEAGVARQPVVDVAADAHRQVDALRLEARDLAAEELRGRGIIGARVAQKLVVALVAAEHGVGQVQPDDADLRKGREPLV